jgi:hypothetical protein
MKKNKVFLRNIHLDFHTGPKILDIGKNFNPEEFAQTFKEADVDSVYVFAKCHHGHLYYNTDRPERHPGLPKDLNLLKEQIEALHKNDILSPVYMSVQCDEYAANTHPEWIAIDIDGKYVKWGGGPFTAGWQILDMSSPYQDYLAEQLEEVLKKFAPIDGIMFDMCWDQVSVSKYAIDGMRKKGYDPKNPQDRNKYAREIAYQYMERYKKIVMDYHKNYDEPLIWFNSRPKTTLHIEKKFINHISIESLPTGGWGYTYFPYVIHYVRPLKMITYGLTSRFHKSWGDFGGLKPEAAMKYECCQMLSQNVGVGIGDQMHPRGTLDKIAYKQIGKIYQYIKKCEPYMKSGEVLSEIGVFINPELGDNPGAVGIGIIRLLQELRYQFDFLPPESDIDKYSLIILTEMIKVDEKLRIKLEKYVENGGNLIISGESSIDNEGKPIMKQSGIEIEGKSPYTTTYLKVDKSISHDVADMNNVLYENGFRMKPEGKDAYSLCSVVEPYFERAYDHFCSHYQTPPDKISPYSAIIQKDKIITFSFPIFTAYGKHANLQYKKIFHNCIKRLLPEPIIKDEGPSHLETSVIKNGKNIIVHLLSFYSQRKAENMDIIEDSIPIIDMFLSVKIPQRPKRVFYAPEEKNITFEYINGRVEFKVSFFTGHTMVVFEDSI